MPRAGLTAGFLRCCAALEPRHRPGVRRSRAQAAVPPQRDAEGSAQRRARPTITHRTPMLPPGSTASARRDFCLPRAPIPCLLQARSWAAGCSPPAQPLGFPSALSHRRFSFGHFALWKMGRQPYAVHTPIPSAGARQQRRTRRRPRSPPRGRAGGAAPEPPQPSPPEPPPPPRTGRRLPCG